MNGQTMKQTGSIILSFALIIFIISLALAGYVLYRRQIVVYFSSHQPTATADIPPDNNDPLSPKITIDPTLADQSDIIHSNIIEPMRQYYATRSQRLNSISVTSSTESSFQVTVTLTEDNDSNTISFESDGSQWTPTLLEDSPPDQSPSPS